MRNAAASSNLYTPPGIDISTEVPSRDRKKRLTIRLINANLKTEPGEPANKIPCRFFYRQRLVFPNETGPPSANPFRPAIRKFYPEIHCRFHTAPICEKEDLNVNCDSVFTAHYHDCVRTEELFKAPYLRLLRRWMECPAAAARPGWRTP